MKYIRKRGASFETNSSSSHSVYVGDNSSIIDQMIEPVNGVIEVYPCDYGWEWAEISSPLDKLNYLVSAYILNEDKLEQISEMVEEVTGGRLVILDNPDKEWGLVDHQSIGILDGYSFKEIVFSSDCTIFTGNDNDTPSEYFYSSVVGIPKYSLVDSDGKEVGLFHEIAKYDDAMSTYVEVKNEQFKNVIPELVNDVTSVLVWDLFPYSKYYKDELYHYSIIKDDGNEKVELDVPFTIKVEYKLYHGKNTPDGTPEKHPDGILSKTLTLKELK